MAADYPSSLCYSGLVIVTEWIAVHDWCGTRRTMQSCLMTAPNETLVQPLPRMRPIYHYDTTLDCVMPLTKAILCQQFNAFVQFPDSQALTKKAVLESLRMINADQIHHQLRNFNDSRLNRCFDALIVLLEEDVPVLITWPTLSSIRLMLRTRHRFEARMPQYYSTLPFRVRAGLENRHAIRRFAQNERIRIYIRYTCELIQRNIAMHRRQRLSVSSPLDYDENTIPRSVLEQTGKTGQCPGPAEGTAEEEEVVKVEKL